MGVRLDPGGHRREHLRQLAGVGTGGLGRLLRAAQGGPAATIFIAFVICCVDRTVPIRFRSALRLGTVLRLEELPELGERGVELRLHVVVSSFFSRTSFSRSACFASRKACSSRS
jgi:hypothetical protein